MGEHTRETLPVPIGPSLQADDTMHASRGQAPPLHGSIMAPDCAAGAMCDLLPCQNLPPGLLVFLSGLVV